MLKIDFKPFCYINVNRKTYVDVSGTVLKEEKTCITELTQER